MIWYGNEYRDAPKLHWAKPYISDEHIAAMKLEHPPAIPGHCLPWINGQSAGLVVVWPFDDIQINFEYRKLSDNNDHDLVHEFADGHWSINPRYFFRTQENVGLLTLPHKTSELSHMTVRGLIETDWYAPAPFFVFTYPHPRRLSIIIKHGDPLLELVPVVIDKGLAQMTDEQLDSIMQESTDYNEERFKRKDLIWTSDKGQGFSRLYKEISRGVRNV